MVKTKSRSVTRKCLNVKSFNYKCFYFSDLIFYEKFFLRF